MKRYLHAALLALTFAGSLGPSLILAAAPAHA